MLFAIFTCRRCNWKGELDDMPYKKTKRGVERVCPICFKNDEIE